MKTINLICNRCKIKFDKPHNEYNRQMKRGKSIFYCSHSCAALVTNEWKRNKPLIKMCPCCNGKFETSTSKKSKTYCSRSCASKVSRNKSRITDAFRKQQSERALKSWSNPDYIKNNLKNIGKRRFTSKGEEEIKKHFKEKYKNDNWTCGCRAFIDNVRLNIDLYSDKLNVCIEYDGVWHFKDINGQLEDKQRKDLLLEKWCNENNFRLIRIKEDIYKQDKKFWIDKLEQEVYNSSNKLVKFYDNLN